MSDVKVIPLLAMGAMFACACTSELAGRLGNGSEYLDIDGSVPADADHDAGEGGTPHGSCPPGTFVMDDSDPADPQCDGCASGTFSLSANSSECASWTV